VENSDKKSLAILFGLQSSLFGLQGLQGSKQSILILSGTLQTIQIIQISTAVFLLLFDKKLGDYLLYGTVSNWLGTGLYTRGDIQPRQITILPVNPKDYPAVSGSIKFLSNIFDASAKIKRWRKFNEYNPAGIRTQWNQSAFDRHRTNGSRLHYNEQRSLISASNDWFSLTSAARMNGSRPLDEALTMDALYRKLLIKQRIMFGCNSSEKL